MATGTRVTFHSQVPLWRNVRVYRIVGQIVFVVLLVLVGLWFYDNMLRGLGRMNARLSFDFLQGSASFAIGESVIPYEPSDPYWYVFLAGLLNTLKVSIVGIFLATLLGLFAGIARLSSNWLVSKIAQVYVEIFQDTPLLIQLFFWYFAFILKLPRVRESLDFMGAVFLSNRGLSMPWPNPAGAFWVWLVVTAIGLLLAFLLTRMLGRLPRGAWLHDNRGLWALLLFLTVAGGGAVALDAFAVSMPQIKGFNYEGGITLSPEYFALLLGLVFYTGAFIAEIVRAGILAVPRGLTEASRALGLTMAQTLRLVTIPVALRVILPPLTNQYLNLAKNSSLAVAIGFADLFYVGNTIFNNTGQTVQIVVLIMATYLAISLTIAFLMNQLNARFRLVER